MAKNYNYDFFISFADADADWVQGYLIPNLGLSSDRLMTRENFPVGSNKVAEFERAITQSRYTLLILSPAFLKDEWSAYGDALVAGARVIDARNQLIPLKRKTCELPLHLEIINELDFTGDYKKQQRELKRLRGLLNLPEQSLPCLYSPPPELLSYTIQVFLATIAILLLILNIINGEENPNGGQNLLPNEELYKLGTSSTLQVKVTLKDGTERYGSATVWEKNKTALIIVTTYHVLQGTKSFEILAPNQQGNDSIPSSELNIYVKPDYDLVFIKLNLTNEVNGKYLWLSKVQVVKNEECDLPDPLTKSMIFGFSSSNNIPISKEIILSSGSIHEQPIPCVSNEKKKFLFFDRITENGMGGGPIIDETGCFQGMLLGVNPNAKTMALYSKEIKVSLERFNKFDASQFTEELCWIEYKN